MPQTFDVFDYRHSSELLNAYVAHRKQHNKHFSVRGWAKRLNLPSSGIIVNFLKGRRIPTEELVPHLCETMSLGPEEREYFAALVAAERAKNFGFRSSGEFEQKLELLRFKRTKTIVPAAKFRSTLSLGLLIVKVLLENRVAGATFEQLLEKILIPIDPEQIESILLELIELGVIEKLSEGTYRTVADHIETENDHPSEAIRAFHVESLQHAMKSLETVEVSRRHFSSYLLAVDSKRLPEAKVQIESFVDQFTAKFESKPGEGDQVYQLNLNFVPLTKA